MIHTNESFVSELVSSAVSKKHIYGAILCVENEDDSLSFLHGAGNLSINRPYFIASVTKLYVTAVLLRLRSKNYLSLHNKIEDYLSDEILHDLHIFQGKEYSREITLNS
ncbi:beta-lactamase family protein [Guptibacillus algicola]|uniref:beta-lactamase family protein n=1 Tax=Guptibacillus algicola TaxID=225844 RepID=UPI0021E5830B|nr:beta-lactamase family protein [Alkalihalobacillus algicola]